MQSTFVNLCYTMENHAIATMMTYFGSTDHGLGTEVDIRPREGFNIGKGEILKESGSLSRKVGARHNTSI